MARRAGGAHALRVSVGTPVGDTPSVAATIRAARSASSRLRIVGGGSWLDAGRPVRADATLPLDGLRGVTEFQPGDFTLTARAGTALAEIASVAASEGQWLTLEPFGSDAATIGATIATASWGPLASAFGTPRDHLLGCEFVTGRGEIVRAGGRVVKNVAGFDLARLMTGAWGTLGVITEVTVRLRARPEVDRTFAVAIEGDEEKICDDAARWLLAAPYRPLAAELCSPALSERIGLERRTLLLVRLGGNEPLVRATERAVAELGSVSPVETAAWDRLRGSEPVGAPAVRLGALPASLAAPWSGAVRATSRSGGWCHATLTRGVVRCVLPLARTAEENGRLGGMISELRAPGSRVAERLPEALWTQMPSAVGDPLSRQLRRTFDPDAVLNPGILDSIT